MTITTEMWIGFAVKTSPLWVPGSCVLVLMWMMENEEKVERWLMRFNSIGSKRWL